MDNSTGRYLTSSAVARRANCHQNTVKNYTRRGLLNPLVLTDGTRVYEEADLPRLRELVAEGRARRRRGASQ